MTSLNKTANEVQQFLVKRGFKVYDIPPDAAYGDTIQSISYQIRIDNIPTYDIPIVCQCNDKVFLNIEHSFTLAQSPISDNEFHYLTLELRHETLTSAWVDLKVYGLTPEEFYKGFYHYIDILIRMWNVSNENIPESLLYNDGQDE